MNKSAAIYIRQSSNRPGDNTTSPEDQEANCRELPAVAACGPNVEVFTDLNKSGGDTKRTGYAAFLQYIRAGGVSVVSFYDDSRIARHNMTSAEFYALMEEHPEIEVVMWAMAARSTDHRRVSCRGRLALRQRRTTARL